MSKRIRRGFTLLTISMVVASMRMSTPASQTATNVIFFIGDGMGTAQVRAGRSFIGKPLSFESWTYRGMCRTYSASDPAITDSAAAGTALATGHKVYNGVVSIASPGDGHPYETVLEYMQRKGKRTALVTNKQMTDATPAVFAAHQAYRGSYNAIATDFLRRSRPHVLLGGGGYGMTPEAAAAAGYTVVLNRWQMQALAPADVRRVSGQFGLSYMPYESDGLGDLPHLSQMTETALQILDAQSSNGFFVMVEGGMLDFACHANDIRRCVREMAEFDASVRVALNWTAGRTDTLMIVTADHECGGLAVLADNGPGNEPTVTWSSSYHTTTNVPVYALGPGAERLSGEIDNTDVYRAIMLSQPITPEAVGIALSPDGGVVTRWSVRPGSTCRLETACPPRASTNWSTLGTATADTHEVTIPDTNAPAPQGAFYRLIVE